MRLKATCPCGSILDIETTSADLAVNVYIEWDKHHRSHQPAGRVKSPTWVPKGTVLMGGVKDIPAEPTGKGLIGPCVNECCLRYSKSYFFCCRDNEEVRQHGCDHFISPKQNPDAEKED